jgi:toxin-antitoxin system PIN domain toxin
VILCDVNVLVYAYRPDADDHQAFRRWLIDQLSSEESFGVSDLVLSAFVRVVSNPRAFANPDPVEDALEFAGALREQDNAVAVAAGPRHWRIFDRLCRQGAAKGNLVSDAYLAALAIESGSEWITTDRDFARFPNLRWRHPLAVER